ncbi:hypothetical protein QR680_003155 [Steinernema hermaphroditum]|uniref:Coatomer subunit delta n=1 Tax=Steinernema hermaphroditum TaxID=289476 RepID=A0AA39H7I1_9BILA|nr:hypothetical protein QR680_003155 [Steinernema hermaphroditum]
MISASIKRSGKTVASKPLCVETAAMRASEDIFYPADEVKRNPFRIRFQEKFNAIVNEDGNHRNGKIERSVKLNVSDQSMVNFVLEIPDNYRGSATLQPHRCFIAELWQMNSTMRLKGTANSFPCSVDEEVLKWSLDLADEEQLPIMVTCLTNTKTDGCFVKIEYKLREAQHLENIAINIPLPSKIAPVVSACDGSHEYNDVESQLRWTIPVINKSTNTGTLQFTTANSGANNFFPINVLYSSPDKICEFGEHVFQTCEKSYPKQMYEQLQALHDIEHLLKKVLYVGDVEKKTEVMPKQIVHLKSSGGSYKIVQESLQGYIEDKKCAIVTKIFDDQIFPTVVVNEDEVTKRALEKVGKTGRYSLHGYNCFSFVNEVSVGSMDSVPALFYERVCRFLASWTSDEFKNMNHYFNSLCTRMEKTWLNGHCVTFFDVENGVHISFGLSSDGGSTYVTKSLDDVPKYAHLLSLFPVGVTVDSCLSPDGSSEFYDSGLLCQGTLNICGLLSEKKFAFVCKHLEMDRLDSLRVSEQLLENAEWTDTLQWTTLFNHTSTKNSS